MKTAQEWLQETPLDDFSSDEALQFIATVQSDARAGMVEESKLAAAEQRVKELEAAFNFCNIWRESWKSDAERLLGKLQQKDERERVLREVLDRVCKASDWGYSAGKVNPDGTFTPRTDWETGWNAAMAKIVEALGDYEPAATGKEDRK